MNKFVVLLVCAIVSILAFGEQRNDSVMFGNKDSVAVKARKPIRCSLCSGTGTLTVSTREICEDCGGTGVVVTDVTLADKTYAWERKENAKIKKSKSRQGCKACKRSGKITVKRDKECPRCKGSGEY